MNDSSEPLSVFHSTLVKFRVLCVAWGWHEYDMHAGARHRYAVTCSAERGIVGQNRHTAYRGIACMVGSSTCVLFVNHLKLQVTAENPIN